MSGTRGRGVGAAPSPLSMPLLVPISGVGAFFVKTFDVPPFLLPIYQAAGIAYGVPWQVLAAINEVETDYGQDLDLSSAGAEGWMQFLPAEWAQYGVDATGSGWSDPYNPVDAIFAAASYLQAAGGSAHIRAAVYAYNHSQAYVASVMLRAQLLGGMPPEMLGALTNLAEARFPVHAPSHFKDGFAPAPGAGGDRLVAGTTIHSQPEAPVVAVKDGTVTAIGESRRRGLYITLEDAYGVSYTYADLGSVASDYPVLRPRGMDRESGAAAGSASGTSHARAATADTAVTPGTETGSSEIADTASTGPGRAGSAAESPQGPASAGVQARSPLSAGAVSSGLAFGAAPDLEQTPGPKPSSKPARRAAPPRPAGSFTAGPERVTLRSLKPGSQVIAGTVLGHLADSPEAQMVFQIRPGGGGTPPIDPKPILDSWVSLEDTSVFNARGESPFLEVSPTAGQVLLESRGELEQQLLRDSGVKLTSCGRRKIEAGAVDRRLLASLELLSVSGLHPTVAQLTPCGHGQAHSGLRGYHGGAAANITAINGVPVAGHASPGGVADLAERKLMTLQGTMSPAQIAGPVAYERTGRAASLPASRSLIHFAFAPLTSRGGAELPGSPRSALAKASSATATSDELTPEVWSALIARLGEIPQPKVSTTPSSAALADEQPVGDGGAEG